MKELIKVNQNLCIGCGACAVDCPGKAIQLKEKKAIIAKPCICCGHCVAICPTKAVSIPEFEMDDVEEYDKEAFAVDSDTFLRAVKFRRSIRNFKEAKIDTEKVKRVLDAGRYTATAKNMQGCTFAFVQEDLDSFKELAWKEVPQVVEALKESYPEYAKVFHFFMKKKEKNAKDDTFFFNTPAFLVIASENPLDAGLAAANIESMAVSSGLGVLYSGYMMRVISSSKKLREWLEVGKKPIACCMLLGYPAVTYKRTAPRRKADIIWK